MLRELLDDLVSVSEPLAPLEVFELSLDEGAWVRTWSCATCATERTAS